MAILDCIKKLWQPKQVIKGNNKVFDYKAYSEEKEGENLPKVAEDEERSEDDKKDKG